jgi:hypothetical protein
MELGSIYVHDPETKEQTKEWNTVSLCVQRSSRDRYHRGRSWRDFWDRDGILLVDYLEG